MTEVERTALSTLIQSKKEKCRSIRASRKRKLHELYCVATQVDALPVVNSVADDSQPTSAEEIRFLDDNVVLQGPFFDERNLPPRRIPAPAPVHFQHADAALVSKGASSEHLPAAQDGISKSILPPTAPQQSGPVNLKETRDALPTTPPASSPAPLPPPAASTQQQNDENHVSQTLETSQNAKHISTNGLQSDPAISQHIDGAQGSQPQREGLVGREVSFAEPEKASMESEQGLDSAQHVSDHDAMNADEQTGALGSASRLDSLRPPPLDAPRPPDVLSSPGSTAQTATTPAVHDGSPDTSPDHEGPQYPDDEDDIVPEKVNQQVSSHREAGQQSAFPSAPPSTRPLEDHSESPAKIQRPSPAPTAAAALGSPYEATPATEPSALNADETNSGKATMTTQPPSQLPHDSTNEAEAPTSHAERNKSNALSQPDSIVEPVNSTTPTQGSFGGLAAEPCPQQDLVTKEDSQSSLPQQMDNVIETALRKRRLTEKHGYRHKRAPTVMFAKPAKKADESIVASQPQDRPHRIPTHDYYVPLFFDGFTRQSKWMKTPEQLLSNTHKTLSSLDCNVVLQESQACKVLRRVYHLQQNDKWSLRQPRRCPEPIRQPGHWDLMLQEMKWMRTDFREERKWKRVTARNLAEACAEWLASSEDERKLMQVNAKVPPRPEVSSVLNDVSQPYEADVSPTPMPDLVPSDDADSHMDVDEEPHDWTLQTVAPSAIFALQDDEAVFGLQRTAASDQLLEELPLYQAPLKVPQADSVTPEYDPDARWRRPALPLSKYVEGEMVLKPGGPTLKQSRYKHVVEDEEDEFEVPGALQGGKVSNLPPENTDVALFRPEMKMIRDRLHTSHQFRPPTESLMPLQSFYENRSASVWTSTDDDRLREEVQKYSYNWSLISKNISSKSLFISAEDRRTPWECFERWVQLEGFPNDVAKTQYFMTYQRRIESAQKAIAQANENARPQVGPNGAVTPAQRRRSTLPFRVDRKASKRHFAVVDAMKKLAKKREAAIAKQQQAANNQNRRTSTENQQQKLPTKSPEDYSRLRYEREKQMHEKLLRFNQQQQEAAQRQVALQSRGQNPMGRVPGTPGAPAAAQNGVGAHVAGMANPLAARLAGQVQGGGQARPRLPIQQQQALAAQMAAGGLVPPMPVNLNGMTQAQLAVLQASQRMHMTDTNVMLQARQVQAQQRRQQAAQQQAQAQAHGHTQVQGHHSSPQQALHHAQQLPPQHSPPQSQAQMVPPQQPNHSMPNGSAPQANSPVIRNGMNSVNQGNFMMNSMAAAYVPNGMGMATSPGGVGMNMQNGQAGSPPTGFTQPRGMPASMQPAFAELENRIRMQHPDQNAATIRQIALVQYQQQMYSRGGMAKSNVVQNAMDAAAGSPSQQPAQANGIPNASSPQQYAQLLRQQQLQQQQGQPPQIAQQQPQQPQQQSQPQPQPQQQQQHQQQQQQQAAMAAAAARQVNPQHQRQPSGGATPMQGR